MRETTNPETTTMGDGPPNDRNHAICICDAREVHDLLPCEIAPCECGTHGVVYCGDYWDATNAGENFRSGSSTAYVLDKAEEHSRRLNSESPHNKRKDSAVLASIKSTMYPQDIPHDWARPIRSTSTFAGDMHCGRSSPC